MSSIRYTMSIAVTAAILFLFSSVLHADEIDNIRHYRISDTAIIIYYDLRCAGPRNISVEVSPDGGVHFSIKPRTLSGDVGNGIMPGLSKRIRWDIADDGIELTENAVIRVITGSTAETLLPSQETGKKTVVAVRTDTSLKIDGLLNESSWINSVPASGFIQREQTEGAPATEKTEIRILYDDENVYIGVMCYDSNPGAIIRNEMDRDVDLVSDDNFTLVLDTFEAKRSGYFFEINPNGARYDGFFYGGELINPDWDGVWDAVTRVTDSGWSAEVVIPFKTLRFPNTESQTWGINFRRIIRRKNEEVLWCSWKRDDGLFQLIKAGNLTGIQHVHHGRKFEFMPYVLGGMEKNDSGKKRDLKYGGDIIYPITTDLTLNVTTYTDFAQVETDKEQINLTRFSLFYPEKRDFFLEGSEIYDFDTGYFEKVYHSRRIGISPEREQVPIIGGVNLSGRIGSYSIGVLNIQTDSKGIYPEANSTVIRLKKDIWEKSRIGLIATNLYDSEKHQNTTAGMDVFYQTNRFLGNKNFSVRGDVTGSFTDGRHEDNLFGRLFIDYPNDLIDSFWELYHVGERFNPEIGFITRTGIRRVNGAVRVYPRPQIPMINKLIFKPLGINYIADMDGTMLERTITYWPFGILTTTNDLIRFEIEDGFDFVDRTFTIFGDAAVLPGKYHWTGYGVYMLSNPSRPLSLEVTTRTGTFYSGDRDNLKAAGTYKLNKNISVSSEIDYNGITLEGRHFITREYGSRLHLNLSTKLTTSTFIQWNNQTREVNMNFRLHYIPNIGSDLYFVYNHLWDESADYETLYRTGILKLSYLFRF
ncbi:carbohydrate binding family 9 domain-containing protein [bacterium]|nr:carbohydrate binding family 9 domain-containing protein [bacterium]